ncbi:MAG TPA: alpha/beta hydrolase-fold protein [Candidatus Dormibacteraeota bacterium]|nr:alpha/beta hydrolase-fold protein [Candidatus Dormibacteraeota bacterium]
MEPWVYPFAGRLEEHWIDSQALTGNPLGDSHRRPVLVQLPPGYDDDAPRRFPTIYLLQGLTGQVDMWRNRHAFTPNTPEAVDALFASPGVSPAIVVYVDAWTRLGGSQFLDSPGTGRYHTYLCGEVVPFVDATYRTLPDAAHRGVAGKSSGGYGAMVSAMLRPDLFSALATHAGDALFEHCYLPEFREGARAMREEKYRSFEAFWADFRSRPGHSRKTDGALLNLWCMAACYSTDADGTVRLPFEPTTGRLIPDVWERWLERDPVRMAPRHADALLAQRAIWIDAGRSDEFFLDLGAEAFRQELERLGITKPVVHYELFEGTHGGTEWRYPMAIGWLSARLSPEDAGRR